ncbi:hypothetical protein VU05_01695 [Desulfobulbus sp. F1]|nr:hypothetical protein [Desulfobulbus sp. F1]
MDIHINNVKIRSRGTSNTKIATADSTGTGQIKLEDSVIDIKHDKDFKFAVQENTEHKSHESTRKSIYIMGFLSLLSILGGIVGIFHETYSVTEINFLGFKIITEHVGLAFTGIGLISMIVSLNKLNNKNYQKG